MDSQTYQAIAMSTYFVFMLLIGFWAYRRTKDFDDYMLAGRTWGLSPPLCQPGRPTCRAGLLMGLPGALYLSGLVELWIAIGLTAVPGSTGGSSRRGCGPTARWPAMRSRFPASSATGCTTPGT